MNEDRYYLRDGRLVRAGSSSHRIADELELDRHVRRAIDDENVWPNPSVRVDVVERRAREAVEPAAPVHALRRETETGGCGDFESRSTRPTAVRRAYERHLAEAAR